jgi:hypothetical protein
MVRTPLDNFDGEISPTPLHIDCALCGKPLVAHYHYLFGRWLHSTVHDKCVDAYDRKIAHRSNKSVDQEVPPRFARFEARLAIAEAVEAVEGFSPASELKTLAIIGVPARAKSRLMWCVIQGFFAELERKTGLRRWVDYYIFPDLVTEQDRSVLTRIKLGKYVFIDDIGCTESYGRERAGVQDVIRARVQKNMWTFLTIDDPDFDRFRDIFRDRAIEVWIDR